MSTRSINIIPGPYYHIYNRGNNRQKIFLEERNYQFFLDRLQEYFNRNTVLLLAYCLMPNHFHLLIRLEHDLDFSNVMRSFSTSYVKSFNRWHGRTGHLFEDDFQAKSIESNDYLTRLIPYIHLNPVNAQLVRQPDEWVYSDYSDWISGNSDYKTRFRDELFGDIEQYKVFVMDFTEAIKYEKEIEKLIFGR